MDAYHQGSPKSPNLYRNAATSLPDSSVDFRFVTPAVAAAYSCRNPQTAIGNLLWMYLPVGAHIVDQASTAHTTLTQNDTLDGTKNPIGSPPLPSWVYRVPQIENPARGCCHTAAEHIQRQLRGPPSPRLGTMPCTFRSRLNTASHRIAYPSSSRRHSLEPSRA